MWLTLAFTSALLLGLYDVAKKRALQANAVLPVLLLNTLFCSLFFLPFLFFRNWDYGWDAYVLVFIKAVIVLTSWIFGYFGLKNLPLTIVGPINATRPVLVLIGAMLLFGERLNLWQWAGIALSMASLLMLSFSGKKEGVDFVHNKWILCVAAAALVGAVSGLYDRYIVRRFDPIFVQSWYTLFQLGLMALIVRFLWWPKRRATTPFHWSWAILFISIFLSLADFAYFNALSYSGALVSVVSMIRRGSVIVSFLFGAFLFKEHNLKAKAIDLVFILIGMLLLYIGSR